MVYNTWKIERYAKNSDSDTWSTTAETITSFYDPVVRTSLGDGKDTFSFKLTNYNGEYDDYWNIGDKVVIYHVVNTSTITSTDILMNGIVTNLPNKQDSSQNIIRVEGNNFSETLMSALAFYDPNADVTIDTFIKGIINSVALLNDNFKVTWTSTTIPSKKRDGVTDFPTTHEKWFYKNVTKALEKFSQNSQTQDGNYYWYVDVNNQLVWQPRKDAISYTFDKATDNYLSFETKRDVKDVVNFVIAKGDADPKGRTITDRYDDPVSRAKHGFKYYLMISNKNYAQFLLENEGLDKESYKTATYPFTTAWGVTVTSSDNFVEELRLVVKALLRKDAKAYVEERNEGKLIVELEFINGKGWAIGDVIGVTIPEIGKVNNPMRVQEVEISNSGERYTLIEDEGTI
jgi:hypothetical protein